jgi:uroporphyrinogen decarboxylase
MKYVVDMVDSIDLKNLIIAPDCDMSYDIPVENAIACSEASRDINKTRELVKNYEAVDEDIEVEIPDYDNLDKVMIETFTLDSASCAACTYMWAKACDAKIWRQG